MPATQHDLWVWIHGTGPDVTLEVALAVTAAPAVPTAAPDAPASNGTRLRQWLMTCVSYMIPFVAAGGILIALSFILGGPQVATKVFGGTFHGHTYPAAVTGIESFTVAPVLHAAGLAGLLFLIGKVAFFMLVPLLVPVVWERYILLTNEALLAGM